MQEGKNVNRSKYMILGGGMVAGYAAKGLVEGGLKKGELTILSADNALPYERPPLSKSFLAGKDDEKSIRINAEEFYGEHGIEVRLECHVAQVDSRQKAVHLQSGEDLIFENLIVATGAQVRKLSIPGSNLAEIYYLRSMEDSKKIRARARNAKRAAVVGGGFISMEVSAVLAQGGIETTMLIREDRIWKRFFTSAMSKFFESYYTARGVRLVKETNLSELKGEHAVKSVSLEGGQTVECDMLVAGIGVTPVIEPVADSGMQLGNGVLVNEYLETNVPGVYAAGDVASYQDPLFGKRRRVEHWDNAVSQGQHCARALLGDRAAFLHVPYFFSDVFDLSYEFWGDPANADQTVERGDLSSSSFSVWWLQNKRVVAAFVMSRPDEERDAAAKWIESKQQVSPEKLKGKSSVLDAEEPAS
jgi:NADPH-dependent 2,4-dienoyl-CoA reductase/sulfur reductase-like enzyme